MIEPNFAKGDGLIPAIVQDAETKEVLMMAYMNRAIMGGYSANR